MKLSTKITLVAVSPVLAALAAVFATMLAQHRSLTQSVDTTVRQQAFSEGAKVAQSAYLLCASAEARNQKDLTHSLGVARDLIAQAGGIHLSDETAAWQVTNQLTKEAGASALPKVMLGSRWLGQVGSATESAVIVDDVSHFTGNFCTIFERMNDAGDMLRVCTSVLKTDGTRALGTFIPAKNSDGTDNAVVKTVLGGQTYRGRAFVVNDWHAAAYEPIWDAAHARIIGMLYVGVPLTTINKELHDAIIKMAVGKTGYVYVLGASGDQRGRYLVSAGGKRDGENIWDAKDASGRLFIQSVVAKALATHDGESDYEVYSWKNNGETAARTKFAAVTYYAPWDWVIGAGAYEEDFNEVRGNIESAQNALLLWVAIVAGVGALVASAAGVMISRGISRPIARIIDDLDKGSGQIAAATGQVSVASQSLASGSSEQASALEETSASLEEMSGMTNRNAENATKANELARQARQAADVGAGDMQAMSTAMRDIKTSSDDIAKIIKTIDEIAFQTNILALNAAVEAARAGEAGAGFAVVADEVRNLAQRSAQAARETADKIEGAIGKTAQGVEISGKVARSLTEIVEKVRQVDALVAEVTTASREQNQGVQQINSAVSLMDKVVQNNAASAEESASASEELSVQAAMLKDTVGDLQKLVGGESTGRGAKTSASPESASASTLRTPALAAKSTSFGPSRVRGGHKATVPATKGHADLNFADA